MAKKKLTEEQENEIKTLRANNEMLEKTRKEAEERGNKVAVEQIKRAQQEVIDHINMIDPSMSPSVPQSTSLSPKKKTSLKQENLFDTDMSIFDILEETEKNNQEAAEIKKIEEAEVPYASDDLTPSETVISNETTFNNIDSNAQYDVIQLPSNGQCYRNKVDRVPVAYLTAYDENIITSPNLYKDGLVIDFLLKNKIVNGEINVEDLVTGDADAIILFLRATSYGPEFPIVVNDPETGEQIDSVVDLTTLKPRDFKLIGDENGWFEYVTPLKKDTIKFRYLTRKQEKQLKKVTELEGIGTKASLLDRERETLSAALMNEKYLSEADKKVMRAALKTMETWSKKLREVNNSEFTRIMTNNLQLQILMETLIGSLLENILTQCQQEIH